MAYSLTSSQADILVKMHAFLVACLEIPRAPDWISHKAHNAAIYQRDWLDGKPLPYRAGGNGAARREAGRDLGALVAAGLVQGTKPKGRTTGARLTNTGFNLSARLCGALTLSDHEPRHVYRTLAAAEKTNTDRRGVPEFMMDARIGEYWGNLGTREGQVALKLLSGIYVIPLLAAGLVEVRSAFTGAAFYRTLQPYPVKPPRTPEPTGDNGCLVDTWFDAHARACQMLASAEDIEPNELVIPCPA